MFAHSDIWRAIDRLAKTFGYSPSGLAKKAGLDPTTFNKSKRHSADGKPRWPSTESISKVLAVTGVNMSEFISYADLDSDTDAAANSAQTIPLLGYAQAGREGFFDDSGYPAGTGWDEIPFPDQGSKNDDIHVYALKISGDSMEPLYRQGDILIVSPAANIKRGDRVIVKTTKGEVMAKELVRQGKDDIELKSLNPDHEGYVLRHSDVSWTARIMWVSQ